MGASLAAAREPAVAELDVSRTARLATVMKPPKPLDEVDWDEAAGHLVGAFPDAPLAEVVARAEAAAVTLDHWGKAREAEYMRRVAAHIRKRMMN